MIGGYFDSVMVRNSMWLASFNINFNRFFYFGPQQPNLCNFSSKIYQILPIKYSNVNPVVFKEIKIGLQ